MQALFRGRSFNLDISCWDTSNVINMSGMFSYSDFNQDISSWDVGRVTDFSSMFISATAFDQDISDWNVSLSQNFFSMFNYATNFDQNLSKWSWSYPASTIQMFKGAFSTQTNADWTISGSSTNFRSSLNVAGGQTTMLGFFHDGTNYQWGKQQHISSDTNKFPIINDGYLNGGSFSTH
jgi:hypothetical protein